MQKANESDYLAEIYRGSLMGVETIDMILPKVNDAELKNELQREQSVYNKFKEKAVAEMHRRHDDPEDLPKMQEFGAWMGVQLNTMMDSTSSHIADLMIQGNNMGVIGITKTKNAHPDASSQITDLADELIKIQEDNIEKLKPFLR